MTLDPITAKVEEFRDSLRRTGRAQAESHDGYVPLALAAEMIKVPLSTMRNMVRDGKIKAIPVSGGRQRKKRQVKLVSLAAYRVACEMEADLD